MKKYYELIGSVEDELRNAVIKHPHFIDRFLNLDEICDFEEILAEKRDYLSARVKYDCSCFTDVLNCEIAEVVDAYARKEYDHAIQELAQCAAVCLRAMKYISDKHI